jgi:serine/threonine protein kinase
MATTSRSWNPEGVILFSQGDTSYELICELDTTDHGERSVLARRRTPKGAEGQVLVRSVHLVPLVEADAKARARLEEQVRLASYLQHPNIARIHGCYEVGGTLYVVSDAVEGCSVNDLITASQMHGAPFSEAFGLYVGVEVASALHHAHTRTDEKGVPLRIIHRDLSPLRLHMGTSGEVLLTDFALAHSLLPGRRPTTLPRPQGDLFFAAPEALLGEPMDARSDLFGLGLVLLELTTWKSVYSFLPRDADDLMEALPPPVRKTVLGAITTAMEAELPDKVDDLILHAAVFGTAELEAATESLPGPLRDILRKLLQRDPAARYASAAELEEALRAALSALGTPYGAAQAAEESRRMLEDARQHQDVLAPLDERVLLPGSKRSPDDITTAPGGT